MNKFSWGLAVLLFAVYHALVPAPHTVLGDMKDIVGNVEDASKLYPEDIWPGFVAKIVKNNKLEHHYVNLPFGKTHYFFIGPVDGPKIVLVHGITTPSIGMKNLIDELALKGYRILTFDLYGRGYSASPGTHYDAGLYSSQLLALIHHVGWTDINLLGVSLGGAISVHFSTIYPKIVKKLIVVAPAGLLKTVPLPAQLLKIPVIGEVFMYSVGQYVLAQHSRNQLKDVNNKESVLIRDLGVFQALNHIGFKRAFISTLRHFPLNNMHAAFEMVERIHKSNVMGEKDEIIPFTSLVDTVRTLMPSCKLVSVPNATHQVISEFPKESAEWINEFLE